MFILSSCFEREIATPQIFNTKEEAQEVMKKEFAETLNIEVDEIYEFLESDDSCEASINDDYAYCTNLNHDNCDWAIHEIDLPIERSWNDYTLEYCPHCDTEVFIHAHGTTRCPNCKVVLFPCSVCNDEHGGCKQTEPCPYGNPNEADGREPTNPDMSEDELKWCENNFNTY